MSVDATAAYKDGLRGWLRAVDGEDLRFPPKEQHAAHTIGANDKEDAVAAKDKGNDWFKKRDYRKAVEWYTCSLQLDPLSAITVANRAMAHLQLKDYAAAEADSEQAIALDATYVKAYMRRGTARKALGKLDLALEDFETVMRLEKENKQAAQEVALLRQAIATAKKKGEGERATQDAAEQSDQQAGKEKHEPMKSEDAERKRPPHDREKPAEREENHKMDGEKRPFPAAARSITPSATPAVAGSVQEEAKQPSALSSSTILALSSVGTTFVPKAVALAKPKTVFDFEKAWSNIKDDTAAFWNYFLLLEPKSYASFFGNSMTPAIISSILAALMQHGLGENCVTQSLDVLRHLPSIRRWRIILKKEDREVLRVLFDRLLAPAEESKSGGVTRNAVLEVRALYAL